MSTFTWATVTGTSPLRVQLDGDSIELDVTPDSLIDPLALTVGDRVRVEVSRRRLIVHGSSKPTDTGWVNLSAVVSFQSGFSYVADGGSWGGFRARRVGATVELSVHNVDVAAATFTVPTSGNITNTLIASGVPAQFRPAAVACLASGPAGRASVMYVTPAGGLYIGWVAPDATQTGSVAVGAESFSGSAQYFAT